MSTYLDNIQDNAGLAPYDSFGPLQPYLENMDLAFLAEIFKNTSSLGAYDQERSFAGGGIVDLGKYPEMEIAADLGKYPALETGEGPSQYNYQAALKKSVKEKLSRAFRKVRALVAGSASALRRGLKPKPLINTAAIEAFTAKHYLSQLLNSAKAAWLGSKENVPFEQFLIDHPKLCPTKEVRYLNSEEREHYRVTVRHGKLYRNGVPFDTSSESSNFSGKGTAIFVLSPDKKLYMGSHKVGEFHHSSFLGGQAVASAGEMQTRPDGSIIKVTNKSGHYQPSKDQMINILKTLQEEGVDLSTISYEEIRLDGLYIYNNAKAYLDYNGQIAPSRIQR